MQHRAKLSGLLVDRIQVETVDIKGALIEARTRVFIFGTIPPKPLTGLTDARCHWRNQDGHGGESNRRGGGTGTRTIGVLPDTFQMQDP